MRHFAKFRQNQTVAEIQQVIEFNKMTADRHFGFVGTTTEEYLEVLIIVQNLVGIAEAVLII